MRVSVIGAGECCPTIYNEALALGRLLAKEGYTVICGGRGGVMEAVAQGVAMMGGTTIGILPGRDIKEANKYITYPIATSLGEMRNFLVVLNGDVVVAVSGRYGTLSEIALAKKINKKVIALGRWKELEGVIPARDPMDVIKIIKELDI
jgi:uncharacterized protein (TIGR00725 family)